MKKYISLLAAASLLLLPSCKFVRLSDELIQQIKEEGNGVNLDIDFGNDSDAIRPSDNILAQDEVTGEFHNLQISVPTDLVYTPGDCAVNISGPDNILEHINVSNENGTLVIKTDGTKIRNLKNLKINISSPVLEEVTFNGAVDFSAPQGITALDFNATVNGAGDIDISGLKAGKARITVNGAGDATISKIDCDELNLAINGAGDATVSGQAGAADLSISGAGDIDALGLQCENVTSKIRGIGKIKRH